MATRKKKSARSKKKTAYSHGAVKETADRLTKGRLARRREPGDGQGVDVGIANTFGITLEGHLDSVTSPDTRRRLHDHVRLHVDEAMKPLLKIMQRNGASDYDMKFAHDIVPNMFRTIIEYFEEEN